MSVASAAGSPAFLTVEQVARTLVVSRRTVRRLIALGELRAIRTGRPPRGHWRISASALQELVTRGPLRAGNAHAKGQEHRP